MLKDNNKPKQNTNPTKIQNIGEFTINKSTPPSPKLSSTPSPSALIKAIENIISTPVPTPKNSIFKFKNTEKAASFNSKLLRSMDMNFQKTIRAQGQTFLSLGSEFRNPNLLEPIFKETFKMGKNEENNFQRSIIPFQKRLVISRS